MRRAYTLIEVLHVIVIMSVLIASCIPAMAGARHRARAVASMMNLRSLSDVMAMYTANNADGFLNPFRDCWPSTPEYKGMKWTSACVASDPSKRWDFGNSACPDVHTEGFSEVWYSYLAEYRGGRRDDREGCSPLDGELGRTYQAAASNPRVREGRDLLPTSYMYSPTFWINDWPYDRIRCHRLGLVPLYIETARLSLVRFPGQKVVLWERIDFRAGKKAVAWNDRRANTNVSLADWSVKTVNMSSLYDVAEADRSRRLIPGESRCHLPANGGRSFFLHTLDGIWGRDLAQ